jgi:ribonuclease P protein component
VLPKQYRLSSDSEIKKAYKTRFQAKTNFAKLYLSKTERQEFKLLVIISKKIYKKANKRNRCKRKIYAIFESLHYTHRLPPATSCIIQITNKEILNSTLEQIREDILPQISQLYKKLSVKFK